MEQAPKEISLPRNRSSLSGSGTGNTRRQGRRNRACSEQFQEKYEAVFPGKAPRAFPLELRENENQFEAKASVTYFDDTYFE
jgi:hypothetical protein